MPSPPSEVAGEPRHRRSPQPSTPVARASAIPPSPSPSRSRSRSRRRPTPVRPPQSLRPYLAAAAVSPPIPLQPPPPLQPPTADPSLTSAIPPPPSRSCHRVSTNSAVSIAPSPFRPTSPRFVSRNQGTKLRRPSPATPALQALSNTELRRLALQQSRPSRHIDNLFD